MTTINARDLPAPLSPTAEAAPPPDAAELAATDPSSRDLPFWRRLSSAMAESHRASVPF